jgi:SAM-dependent methyltransferase
MDQRLGFHQVAGLLGTGDLHPGGAGATERLLRWAAAGGRGRILEVGAGIGNTARRLVRDGWEVTAIEPDPVLFGELRDVPDLRAFHQRLGEHRGTYDAVIAESVLYALVPAAFDEIHRLLRPGGRLVFSEMVWTPGVDAATSRAVYQDTLDRFGLPVASAEPYTWSDWRGMLARAGFTIAEEERLGAGSPGGPTVANRVERALRWIRRPGLAIDQLRLAWTQRGFNLRGGNLESWLCSAVSGAAPDPR